MSIDISSENYVFDIGSSQDIELLKLQTQGKPLFNKLWSVGKLTFSEGKLLKEECLNIQEQFITSSGKDFYIELLTLISESIASESDIVVHGIYQENLPFDIKVQTAWGKPVTNQEIVIYASAPDGLSKAKWEMINIGLTDDFNTAIKYSPVLKEGKLIGVNCGIYKKSFSKDSCWNEIRGMIIKFTTYKFTLKIANTDLELNRLNFKDQILSIGY